MRNIIQLLSLLIAVFLVACQNSAEKNQSEPAQQQQTPPATAPASEGLQPPYTIEDSSKIKLVDGIQIYVAEEGTGPIPQPQNNVVINYRGTLLDGTFFDGSFSKPGVADYPLPNLIKGWQIALTSVRTGSKVRLIIPPELGYGAQGSPPIIPPNATLIFDIHLISAY
ncbi:MAG: FKBP-type peptidyl-prolyl cis-trans isomerase [Bacteroidota bacterium]